MDQWGLNEAILRNFAKFGKGTRRPLRVGLSDLEIDHHPDDRNDLRLCFTLPSGAYATVVLRELFKRS
ncbi:MAG: tRNA pseudouridine(13) synthase TruD [Myxococcales bacterium]|nr:MAG: tRNA pseudouridine(13) synthase TruD [Myxococcales bacterium]